MSLENERGKCQLTSCENRMSIKDRVLKILARDYITILTNGEPTAEICGYLTGSVSFRPQKLQRTALRIS